MNDQQADSIFIASNSFGIGWQWFRQGLGVLFSYPGRWLIISMIAILVILLATMVGGLIPILGSLLANWFVVAPLTVGLLFCANYCYQRHSPELSNLFYGFQDSQRFIRIVWVNLVWTLLFALFGLLASMVFVGLLNLFEPQIVQDALSAAQTADANQTRLATPALDNSALNHLGLGQWLVLIVVGLVFALIGLVLHYGQVFSSYLVGSVDYQAPKTLAAVSAGFTGAWRNLSALLLMAVAMSALLGLFILAIVLIGALLSYWQVAVLSALATVLLVVAGVLLILLITPWWACANLAAFRQIYPQHGHTTEVLPN